jgi:hypothetical protein
LNSGALKAANARVSSLEAELEASRTAFDAATAAKVNAEKSAKSTLAKAKKQKRTWLLLRRSTSSGNSPWLNG